MTAAILIFLESLPNTLASARTAREAPTLPTGLQWVVSLLAPIISAVQWLVWRVLWLFGVGPQNPWENAEEAAHEEIRGAVALHHKEGSVEREHRNMIGGILDLRELTVADVMM